MTCQCVADAVCVTKLGWSLATHRCSSNSVWVRRNVWHSVSYHCISSTVHVTKHGGILARHQCSSNSFCAKRVQGTLLPLSPHDKQNMSGLQTLKTSCKMWFEKWQTRFFTRAGSRVRMQKNNWRTNWQMERIIVSCNLKQDKRNGVKKSLKDFKHLKTKVSHYQTLRERRGTNALTPWMSPCINISASAVFKPDKSNQRQVQSSRVKQRSTVGPSESRCWGQRSTR